MALKYSTITKKSQAALKPGESLAEHGVVVERTAKGDLRYRVNIMVDGARIHRTIGKASEGVTRETVEQAIETFRTDARAGRLSLPTGRKLHRTVAQAAEEYLDRLRHSDGKNLVPKQRHLRARLVPFFDGERLDRVSDYKLAQYVRSRRAEGASPATVNRELATLRHLLNSAVRWNWISKDRVPEIRCAPEPQQPMFVLSDDEAQALMKAAEGDIDPLCHLFVAFGLGSAMRHREILATRYDQLDIANRRIFIPNAKAGARVQPLTETLLRTIAANQYARRGDPKEWIFPSAQPAQSKAGHRTNMARQFARAVTAAGLDPARVTPHTMRRTAITRLVKAGVDLPTIQRISGHKTLTMVLRYVHLNDRHIDTALRQLEYQ